MSGLPPDWVQKDIQFSINNRSSDHRSGYERAVDIHTELTECASSWGPLWRKDVVFQARRSYDPSNGTSFKDVLRSSEGLGRMISLASLDQIETDQIKSLYETSPKSSTDLTVDLITEGVVENLRNSALVYVSMKTLELLGNTDEMPFIEDRYSIPFPQPFLMVFAGPIGTYFHNEKTDQSLLMNTAATLVVPNEDGLCYASFADTKSINDGTLPRGYMPDLIGSYTFGHPINTFAVDLQDSSLHEKVIDCVAALGSRKQRIAVIGDEVRRPARRRAQRAGIPNPGTINVLYRSSEKDSLGLGGTHLSPRRHVVRAHWRRQPCGPRGEGNWRWTLVPEHERGKGPFVPTTNVHAR